MSGNGNRRRVEARRVTLNGQPALALPSTEATEVYVFDATGRHVETIDGMTGAVRLRFQWSDEGLDSITEPGERITRIRRDENGIPVSIATSRGYRTRLGVRDGWLAAVVDPSNQITRISARADASLPNFTTQSAPGPCSATTLGAADRHRRTDG